MLDKLFYELHNNFLAISLMVLAFIVLMVKVKKLRILLGSFVALNLTLLIAFVFSYDFHLFETNLYGLHLYIHFYLEIIRFITYLTTLVYLKYISVFIAFISSSIFAIVFGVLIIIAFIGFIYFNLDSILLHKKEQTKIINFFHLEEKHNSNLLPHNELLYLNEVLNC